MLYRIVKRSTLISAQLIKVTVRQITRSSPNKPHEICPFKSYKQSYLSQRFYSHQPSLEELIVDYDYVNKAACDNKSLIIDVREPDEIKEHGKIPNSVNIPLGTVSSALGTMTDREFENLFKRPKPTEDTEIIFYCMIGKRSGMAQQNAANLGYKNVKNYLGSWTDWASKTVI